jgi:anti-sigma regulatory factor (Ser/Thr protein kinase)
VSAATIVRGSWVAEAAAVPAARHLVRSSLRERGLEALVGDAELLVSELVGNVVLHVGGRVEVVATTGEDEVLVEVTDESTVSPQLRVFSRTSSTGRGMRLVHSLAVEHGVRSSGSGKTVWVRVTTTTAGRSDDDLAESFADVDWLADVTEPADEGDGEQGAAALSLRRAA